MVEIDVDDLPGILRDLVDLIGLAGTMKLVEHYGGVRLYVPVKYDPGHPIAKLLGGESFLKLIDAYGGEEHFDIPKADRAMIALRNRRIREDYSVMSQRQLALKYGLTERQIRNIVAGIEVEDGQESLF